MDQTNKAKTDDSSDTVDCVWNVMTHAQKPDFVFRRNGRVHLNRRGRQFSRLLAAEVCASAEVMLDTPCFEVVWRVLATHCVRQFPLHFPSRTSPCAITFQLHCTYGVARHMPTGAVADGDLRVVVRYRKVVGNYNKLYYWQPQHQWRMCRSRWPRGLRRGSAAARFLGLRVRIPPGAWMFVCCQAEVSAAI